MDTPAGREKLPPLRFGRFDYAAFASMFCYAACSLAVPMTLVVLAKELGFPIDGDGGDSNTKSLGGFLQMGRSAAMVASMLFCGVAAARWGKTRAIAVSIFFMGAGIAICAVSPLYGLLLVGMALAGLGEGVLEGLLTPFVQDLHPGEPGRYLNFSHSFWSVGTLATVLALGALLDAGVSWRYLLGGTAALSLVPILLMVGPGARRGRGRVLVGRHAEKTANDSDSAGSPDSPGAPGAVDGTGGGAISLRGGPLPRAGAGEVGRRMAAILRRPYFWLFFGAMFFGGGGEFSITFWMPAFIQTVYGASAWACGVATACFAGGMIAGRMGSGYFVGQARLRRLVIGSGMLAMVVSLAFPLFDPATTPLSLLYVLLFVSGVGAAPLWPSIQSYACDRMPELDTTMLFVLLSCAGIPGCGFHSWFIGVVGDWFGMQNAFFVPPAAFAVMTALLLWDRRVFYREQRSA